MKHSPENPPHRGSFREFKCFGIAWALHRLFLLSGAIVYRLMWKTYWLRMTKVKMNNPFPFSILTFLPTQLIPSADSGVTDRYTEKLHSYTPSRRYDTMFYILFKLTFVHVSNIVLLMHTLTFVRRQLLRVIADAQSL